MVPSSGTLPAAMLCLLTNLVWTGQVAARGGGGHGFEGFHGEGRMGRGGGMLAPDYVLIAVSSVTGAAGLKKALEELPLPWRPFPGGSPLTWTSRWH